MKSPDAASIIDAVWELIHTTPPPNGQTSYSATKEVVEKYSHLLLNDVADQILGRYIEMKRDELAEEGFQGERLEWMTLYPTMEKRELLRQCRKSGIGAAFSSMCNMLSYEWTLEFVSFISINSRAGSWKGVRKYLTPELLSPRAMQLVTQTRWIQDLGGDRLTVGQLYSRISEIGLDAALEDLEEFGTDVPRSLAPILRLALEARRKYVESGDRLSLTEALHAWDRLVDSSELGNSSRYTQRRILVDAANSFDDSFRERGNVEHLSRAIELWREADSRQLSEEPQDPELGGYLAFSYERRAARLLELSQNNEADATALADRAYEDSGEAIALYRHAYDLAEAATAGFPPAPTRESRDAFTEWMWQRRQKPRHKNAIGRMYMNRYKVKNERYDLDQAIEHHCAARDLLEKNEKTPFVLHDLANVFLARFRASGSFEDLQNTVTTFEGAVQLFDIAQPVFGLECLTDFGLLLFEIGEWAHARTYLEGAHNWMEMTRTERASERARLDLGKTSMRLYETLVACCVRDHDFTSALKFASAGKGRVLGDIVASASLPSKTIAQTDPSFEEDAQSYIDARERIEVLTKLLSQRLHPQPNDKQAQLARLADYPDERLLDDLREARRLEISLWEDVASRYRSLAALGDGMVLTADAARDLAAGLNATLIEYFRNREGWCAFVVDGDEIRYVNLPGINETMLGSMKTWIRSFPPSGPLTKLERQLLMQWRAAVWDPICGVLGKNPGRIFIAPYGDMHSLPLSAGLVEDSDLYALDDIDCCVIPSLGILAYLWKHSGCSRMQRLVGQRVLAVAFAGAPGEADIPEAVPEAEAVLSYFSDSATSLISGDDATPSAVIEQARSKDIIHFSCHGTFHPHYVAQSGMYLAGGRLTVRRIMTDMKLERGSMVTVGACSGARSQVRPGDDIFGLAQAFLVAGAGTVVGSMWRVNDCATRALLEFFYKGLARGMSPARSLRTAMRAVRSQDQWRHPYYWCPFVVSGGM